MGEGISLSDCTLYLLFRMPSKPAADQNAVLCDTPAAMNVTFVTDTHSVYSTSFFLRFSKHGVLCVRNSESDFFLSFVNQRPLSESRQEQSYFQETEITF